MRNDETRFLAILALVALPVAAWIGYGYLTDSPAQSSEAMTTKHPEMARAPDTAAMQTSMAEPMPAPVSLPRRPSGGEDTAAPHQSASRGAIHKCQVRGEVVYSDLPCGPGTDLKTFTPDVATVSLSSRPLVSAPTTVTAAQPVRTRQAEERVAAADNVPDESVARQAECRRIDEYIASIDARLRQPYYPQEGDRLKDERQALDDRRFSLGC